MHHHIRWCVVLCIVMFLSLCSNVYNINHITHRCSMRTNIVIDDDLMAQAQKATGLTTKKEIVEQGLILLIKRKKQQAIRDLRGTVTWEGDLDEMRGRK